MEAVIQAFTITKTNASPLAHLHSQLWIVLQICALILALPSIISMIMFVKLLAQYGLSKFKAKTYASQRLVVMDILLSQDNQDVLLATHNVHYVVQRAIIVKDANQIIF